DRLGAMIQRWAEQIREVGSPSNGSIKVMHLHCAPGASKARNFGLTHASGDIIAFPDDDCWYHPDTLANVGNWFKSNLEYRVLSVGCRDKDGRISGNRWWQSECDLHWINIFRTSGTCCFFIYRPEDAIPLKFDESLGPGAQTNFGSAEDTDFLVTLMKHGIRGRFCSALHIGHPCRNGFIDPKRAERYGAGFGRVLAKHAKPSLFCLFLVLDFIRAIVHALIGHRSRATQLFFHGRGILR